MTKKQRIENLEEKVEELRKILKIQWQRGAAYDGYSPPVEIKEKYFADKDLIALLLDYLGLEVEEINREHFYKLVKREKDERTKTDKS
jgi:hypothetical protein